MSLINIQLILRQLPKYGDIMPAPAEMWRSLYHGDRLIYYWALAPKLDERYLGKTEGIPLITQIPLRPSSD